MSKIYIFLLLTGIAMTLAYPLDNEQAEKGVLLERLVRSADPGHHGHHGGYYGGFHEGYYGGYDHGGHGGYGGHGFGGYPGGGGNAFSQSSANSAAISTPFGSASFSSANSNAGAHGR